MRTLLPLLTVAIALAATPVLASEASTTRIEPRAYYGASVTLEEGVRVFRPLPPHKHVIINPGSQTPLSLSFNELEEKRYNYNYHYGEVSGAAPFVGGVGLPFGFDGKNGRHHGKRPGHFGGKGSVGAR